MTKKEKTILILLAMVQFILTLGTTVMIVFTDTLEFAATVNLSTDNPKNI